MALKMLVLCLILALAGQNIATTSESNNTKIEVKSSNLWVSPNDDNIVCFDNDDREDGKLGSSGPREDISRQNFGMAANTRLSSNLAKNADDMTKILDSISYWFKDSRLCLPLGPYRPLVSKREFERRKWYLEDIDTRNIIGNRITILKGSKEDAVNKYLMKLKRKEIDDSYSEDNRYLLTKNFKNAKEDIKESKVFQFIKKMPKGALLGGEFLMQGTLDIIRDIMSTENLYFRKNKEGKVEMMYFHHKERTNVEEGWQPYFLLKSNSELMRDEILSYISGTLGDDNPLSDEGKRKIRTNSRKILDNIINYKPNFKKYVERVLQLLYDDGILYGELFTDIPKVYDLTDTKYDELDVLEMLRDIIRDFRKDNPDFLGIKFIYTPSKSFRSVSDFVEDEEKIYRMFQKFPQLLIGVSQPYERKVDKNTVYNGFDRMLTFPARVKFFMRGGSSNWWGEDDDQYLKDLFAMKTTRLSYGLSVVKHPKLMELIKSTGTPVEFSPIEAQVLMGVRDLREASAARMFAEDIPVVISNGEPLLWDGEGLSYDFYKAFMVISPTNGDLRVLKQLCLNSLLYNVERPTVKYALIKEFEAAWKKFIHAQFEKIQN